MRPPELDLTFMLEHLDCFETEDSGGDEPYLWIVGFKVDAETLGPPPPGSLIPSLNVQIFPGPSFFKHVVGAGEVNAGETHPIAPPLGVRSFSLKPALLPVAGWFTGLAGVICLLWDEDGFSPSTSEAGFNRFKQVIGPALTNQLNAMMNGDYDEALAKDGNGVPIPNWQQLVSLPWRLDRLEDPHGRKNALAELVRRVKGEISGAIEDAVVNAAGLDELIDPDDLLGAQAQVDVGQELAGMRPFELRFTEDEADYRVRGRSIGSPAHRVKLVSSTSETDRKLDSLVSIWTSFCSWPQSLYWAMAYLVRPAIRFELKALLGPPPASVRWFIDDRPLSSGPSALAVKFSPPRVFGLPSENPVAKRYPGGPGTLTCRADGATLEVVANGLGTFSGKVRALYAFSGDPSLFSSPEPTNIGELLARGYDTGADFEIATLDVNMDDRYIADFQRCAREAIAKHLVQYVPINWGKKFDPPDPPDWREILRRTQLTAQAVLDIGETGVAEPGPLVNVARPRRILSPRLLA